MSQELGNDVDFSNFHLEEKEPTEMDQFYAGLGTFKQDVKILLQEMKADISRFDGKIARIKPYVKVDDPESLAFFKSVLSKHDNTIRLQQTSIEESLYKIKEIQGRVTSQLSQIETAVEAGREVSRKFDFIMEQLKSIQAESNKKQTFFQKVKALFN